MTGDEFTPAELPELGGQLAGGGFEKDFADLMKSSSYSQPTRDVPPLHPGTVTISEEEARESTGAKHDRNLFPNTKAKKLRCQVGLFDLGDKIEREEYQTIINNCLQKGWLLARDEWQRTPEGGAFAAVKVLIPETRRSKNKNKDKDKDD